VKYVSGSVDPRLLYNFVDNHDVERIYEKLNNKQHWTPVHVLLFGLPGVPSIYYGSEFAVRGKKERFSDDTIRPKLNLDELMKAENPYYDITKAIVNVYRQEKALAYGEYKELYLRNGQYAFLRGDVIVAVNNEDSPVTLQLPCEDGEYIGALHGSKNVAKDGMMEIELPANDGEFLIPSVRSKKSFEPLKAVIKPEVKKEKQKADEKQKTAEKKKVSAADLSKPYEEMSVEELQAAILAKMENNGPVTDRMRQDVEENVYRDSLLNWVKSFR
jgi:hypothetical protein